MSFSLYKCVHDRSLGRSKKLGLKENVYSSLYSKMAQSRVTDTTPCEGLDWGAVFGFGFSPDGSLLAAACENKCMLLYDPNNARLIQRRFKTHTDCVNCVRFLDNRTFATCSDDSTVRLWDARFLTSEVRILKGHTSWVKNIEYSCQEGMLITSGFDGNIFGWDINNYSENEKAESLFYINGMMRTKITPNENKMIVSTLGGYFLLIHDLALDYLKEDLSGFKPHLYRLMQLMNTPFDHALQYNHMFTRKRNRVEFMCDFPDTDNAESISTMQVHPQGWCIASRNTTLDEESEWTCVHDIQNYGNDSKSAIFKEQTFSSDSALNTDVASSNTDFESQVSSQSSNRERYGLSSDSLFDYPSVFWGLQGIQTNHNDPRMSEAANGDGTSGEESDLNSSDDDDAESAETLSAQIHSPRNRDLTFSSDTSSEELSNSTVSSHSAQGHHENSVNDISLPVSEANLLTDTLPDAATHQSSSPILTEQRDHRTRQRQTSHSSSFQQNGEIEIPNDDRAPSGLIFYEAMTISSGGRVRHRMAIRHADQGSRQPVPLSNPNTKIRNVKPRLLFYSEEPNIGRGFIKEQSFSSDGRVIASPFGNCVRLLAFNSQCSELCDCVPVKPRALIQVGLTVSQKSSILASTFSPTHCMFVAGARDGSISFCSPKL